jgi:hypothetical protein
MGLANRKWVRRNKWRGRMLTYGTEGNGHLSQVIVIARGSCSQKKLVRGAQCHVTCSAIRHGPQLLLGFNTFQPEICMQISGSFRQES